MHHSLLVLTFSLDLRLPTPPHPTPCMNKKPLEAASSSFTMKLTLWTIEWKDRVPDDTLELLGPPVAYSGTLWIFGFILRGAQAPGMCIFMSFIKYGTF